MVISVLNIMSSQRRLKCEQGWLVVSYYFEWSIAKKIKYFYYSGRCFACSGIYVILYGIIDIYENIVHFSMEKSA